jgi:hypothetical protein
VTRTHVTSETIASVGYERDTRTLELQFTSGGVYRYFDVPPEVHRELMTAESHGRYFARNIRGRYRYARL